MAFAVVWAVLLVTQPPHVNPMIIVSITAAQQNQKTKVFVGRARRHRSLKLAIVHLRRPAISP
jgi:hypothetical protein